MEANPTEFEEQHCLLQSAFQAVMRGDDEEIACALPTLLEENRDVQRPQHRMKELSMTYLEGVRQYLLYSKAVIEGLIELEDETEQMTEALRHQGLPLSLTTSDVRALIAQKSIAHHAVANAVCGFWDCRIMAASVFGIEEQEEAHYGRFQSTINRQGQELLQSLELYAAKNQSGIHGDIFKKLGCLPKSGKKNLGSSLVDEFANTSEFTGQDLFRLSEATQELISDMLVLYDFIRAFKDENTGLDDIACEDERHALVQLLVFLKDEMAMLFDYSRNIGPDMNAIPGLVAG